MVYKYLICFLLILNTSPLLFGQSDRFTSQIFQHITVNDGLAHRTVNTLAQDHNGFIWIGTNNGLHRYDGRQMKVYQRNIQNEYGLPTSRIQKLLCARGGRLWIIGEAGALCWYDAAQDRFHSVHLSEETTETDRQVLDIAEDGQGNIWLATDAGLFYTSDAKADTEPVFQPVDIGSVRSAKMQINRIIIDSRDRIWAATGRGGLHLYNIAEDTVQYVRQYGTPGQWWTLVSRDPGKQLWLSSGFTIYRISLDTDVLRLEEYYDLRRSAPEAKGYIYTIRSDGLGNRWVSTMGSGLFQLSEAGGEVVAKHYPGKQETGRGLTDNHLMDLLVDKYNVLWIGSQAGVFWAHLKRKPFHKIGSQSGPGGRLIDKIVHAVYRDKYLWVGTRNGLSVMDTVSGRFCHYTRLAGNQPSVWDMGGVSCLFKDSRGDFWVGMASGGVFQVKNRKNRAELTFQLVAPSNSLASGDGLKNIVDIVEDDWGRIWVGTSNSGLFVLDHPARTGAGAGVFTIVRNVEVGTLANLYRDPYENIIWAGTWGAGLARIDLPDPDRHELTFFRHDEENPNSISYDRVNPMVKTNRHTLWVGTIGGGLNKMVFERPDSVRYRLFTTENGLLDNTIHTIQKDNAGKLWLGGIGLTRFDPATETFTHYDADDGLQGNLFIVNSDYKDAQGRLYFGGPYGMNFFQPSAIDRDESYPDIVITGLKIRNRKVKVGERINGRVILPTAIGFLENLALKEKENDITIDFLTIHTAIPSKNRLQYRLKGYQEEWIDVDKAHASITYSNLSPGDYIFQVRAANGDGVWNPEVTQLSMAIRPYWYKTHLAYAVYLGVFLLLLWLFRRAILVQSNLRNDLRIAQIEIEKDQELAEMKARFFNNITHELRTPITLIKGPVEELLRNGELPPEQRRSYYHTVHQNANRLFRLVNRLLDFRKSETRHFQLEAARADIIPFAREIYLSFKDLARDRQVTYDFIAPTGSLPIFFDHNKMEIALSNLLSNAFKHTKPGDTVQLKIERVEGACCLKVSDTGPGIPEEEIDRIFDRFYQITRVDSSDIVGTGIGLSMVRSIVDLHGGQIAVETASGQGCTFTLRLPLGRAHLKDEQVVSNFVLSEDPRHYPTSSNGQPFPASQPGSKEILPKLLIVEDNPEIRSFIRSIFSNEFVIWEAANGLEGLAVLRKGAPDLIISDILMEEMDGITFCGEVKRNPDFLHIPLILLTARTSNFFKVDGLSSGADAYLTKPFSAQVLRAQVNSLLQLRASLKQYYANRITLTPKKIEVTSEEALFLEELISTVEEKLQEENLTAESLATDMGMSHSTLYRKVKSYTGESINSFIRSIRLKQAAQLLVDSDLNISQVAYKVGFADVNYFGKCFKKPDYNGLRSCSR